MQSVRARVVAPVEAMERTAGKQTIGTKRKSAIVHVAAPFDRPAASVHYVDWSPKTVGAGPGEKDVAPFSASARSSACLTKVELCAEVLPGQRWLLVD